MSDNANIDHSQTQPGSIAHTVRDSCDSNSFVNELTFDVHAYVASHRQIALIWSIEDVQSVRPDLTADQAWEVLRAADSDHDACIGINWNVLQYHAECLFGVEPEDADSGED